MGKLWIWILEEVKEGRDSLELSETMLEELLELMESRSDTTEDRHRCSAFRPPPFLALFACFTCASPALAISWAVIVQATRLGLDWDLVGLGWEGVEASQMSRSSRLSRSP